MTIKIKRGAEQIVIEIAGRLDTITAPALDKTICEVIADAKHLVLDVHGMQMVFCATRLWVKRFCGDKLMSIALCLARSTSKIPNVKILFSQ